MLNRQKQLFYLLVWNLIIFLKVVQGSNADNVVSLTESGNVDSSNLGSTSEIQIDNCSQICIYKDINGKLMKVNTPINVPSTLDEVLDLMNGPVGRHPALVSASQSLKNRRSSKNAYLLVLGQTGAGKSSAINLLFNTNLTAVGRNVSTTIDIQEFTIPIKVDDLGLNNSNLVVIDTPGLGDTNGMVRDAQFLANLEQYLDTHHELKDHIPNVVLIFAKFTQNRIYGAGSQFVKMLKGFDQFRARITDEHFSNVIFVLTFYSSQDALVRKKPESKIAAFQKTIEDFSLFPKPITIVLAENKGEEAGLPVVNGFYKLDNGEFYPKNLFDQIQRVTNSGGDPIGEAILSEGFKNSSGFLITSKSFPVVNEDNERVRHFMRSLVTTKYPINETEVSKLLETAFQTMDARLKSEYPEALMYTQWALEVNNIKKPEDVPNTLTSIVKLLRNIRLNEANLYLLKTALGISQPKLEGNLIVGHGYNLFKDQGVLNGPFHLDHQWKNSDLGYAMPEAISCKIENGIKNIIEILPDFEDYKNLRLMRLGIIDRIPEEKFHGLVRPGYNLLFNGELTGSLEALREYRRFELTLNDLAPFSQIFLDQLKGLPVFNKSDEDSFKKWKDHLDMYGTHVVQSAYGGGAIKIIMKGEHPHRISSVSSIMDFFQFADNIVAGITTPNKTFSNMDDYDISFIGGYPPESIKNMTKIENNNIGILLSEWINSLDVVPNILESNLVLRPYSDLLKRVGQNYSTEFSNAVNGIYNFKLPKRNPNIKDTPLVREETKTLSGQSSEYGLEVIELVKAQAEAGARMEEIIRNSSLHFQENLKALHKEADEEDERQRLRDERNAQLLDEEKRRSDEFAQLIELEDALEQKRGEIREEEFRQKQNELQIQIEEAERVRTESIRLQQTELRLVQAAHAKAAQDRQLRVEELIQSQMEEENKAREIRDKEIQKFMEKAFASKGDTSLVGTVRRFLRQTEAILNEFSTLTQTIKKHHTDSNISKTVGTSVGLIGSIMTVGGIVLAPFTGGASMAIAGWGFAASAVGGAAYVTVDIIDYFKTSSFKNHMQDIVASRDLVARDLQEKLQNLNLMKEEFKKLGVDDEGSTWLAIDYFSKKGVSYTLKAFTAVGVAQSLDFGLRHGHVLKVGFGDAPAGQKFVFSRIKLTGLDIAHPQYKIVQWLLKKVGVHTMNEVAKNVVRNTLVGVNVVFITLDIISVVNSWITNHPTIQDIARLSNAVRDDAAGIRALLLILEKLQEAHELEEAQGLKE